MRGDLYQIGGASRARVILILGPRHGHVQGVSKLMKQVLHLVKAEELDVDWQAVHHVGDRVLPREGSRSDFSERLGLVLVVFVLTEEEVKINLALAF